jgi:hypothetical protein
VHSAKKRHPKSLLSTHYLFLRRIRSDWNHGVASPHIVQCASVDVAHPNYVVEEAASLSFKILHLRRLVLDERSSKGIGIALRHTTNSQVDGVVLVEDLSAFVAPDVRSHPQLIGMHGVEGLRCMLAAQQIAHRGYVISHD